LSGRQAKAFVTWLYSGKFAEEEGYGMLFELYVFADKTDVPAMKKDIMTYIHRHSHRKGSPDIKDATKAFQVLPKSCGLVRWLADRYVHHDRCPVYINPELRLHVMGARDHGYHYECSRSGVIAFADPCCTTVQELHCDCSSRCIDKERTKRGQACAYHEHATIEEWKGKVSLP
jgi:hypothetical protein